MPVGETELSLIANCTLNFIMLMIVTFYYCYVIRQINICFNTNTKIRCFLVGLAFVFRLALSIYDCTTSTN